MIYNKKRETAQFLQEGGWVSTSWGVDQSTGTGVEKRVSDEAWIEVEDKQRREGCLKRKRGQTEERIPGAPFCPLDRWLAPLASWLRKALEPGEERKTTNGKNSGEWWSSLRACKQNFDQKIL